MIKIGRARRILSKTDEWGEKNCEALVNGEISIDMTKEMVHQALGPPTKIDHQRQRWIYEWDYIKGWEHPPETATNVVMFRDDRVTEIKKEQVFGRLVDKNSEPFSLLGAIMIGVFLFLFFILGGPYGGEVLVSLREALLKAFREAGNHAP